jgi:hypothetical protein
VPPTPTVDEANEPRVWNVVKVLLNVAAYRTSVAPSSTLQMRTLARVSGRDRA